MSDNRPFAANAASSASLRRASDALLESYDRALERHGDTAAGALWPSDRDRFTRFGVMADIVCDIAGSVPVICDFACGTGEMLGYLRSHAPFAFEYVGVDRSDAAIAIARRKFPGCRFVVADVASEDWNERFVSSDYIVINGLFCTKFGLSYTEMWEFFSSTIRSLWPFARRGLAFNVMSKAVDWEREDLFHVSMDDAARLLHSIAGRNVRFRSDYGLYEYAAYALRPAKPSVAGVARPATGDLPVLRAKLPTAERIWPYLQRIDASRTYTNHGPLAREFERRVAAELGAMPPQACSAASGTTAVVGAILGTAGRATPQRPFAILPSFTFSATAVAAELCGYRPYFVDCDPHTWAIAPETVANAADFERCGVVLVVAPFGRPIEQQKWLAFREHTGIPVVIDGAASFDTISRAPGVYVGPIPIALSFHATKAFGIGEGGFVVGTDEHAIANVTRAFEFRFSRFSRNTFPFDQRKTSANTMPPSGLRNWTGGRRNAIGFAPSPATIVSRSGCGRSMASCTWNRT